MGERRNITDVGQQLAEALATVESMKVRAAQAEAELEEMKRNAEASSLVNATTQIPEVSDNILHNMEFKKHIVQILQNAGHAFRDHKREDTIREDGVPIVRWLGIERPYTLADILGVRESDEGHIIVTADGKKRIMQL